MKKFNYFMLSFLLCHGMVQSMDIDPEDFNEFVKDLKTLEDSSDSYSSDEPNSRLDCTSLSDEYSSDSSLWSDIITVV